MLQLFSFWTSRCVQALYPNIAEDGDELSFSTGDIMTVTGQVNSEWLICRLEHRTGIVPANFVQDVNIWLDEPSKFERANQNKDLAHNY